MKRQALALMICLALSSPALVADVSITMTSAIEGPMAAMVPGGGNFTMVIRVKGSRTRMDFESVGPKMSAITDTTNRQVITLEHSRKTAHVLDQAAMIERAGGTPLTDIKVDPTGRTETISGQVCEEYRVSMTMNLAAAAGASPQAPPGAAEMLKGLTWVLQGVQWVAKSGPGISELRALQKAALDASMPLGATSREGGINPLVRMVGQADGIVYLSEMEMTVEGTGPAVDMFKQMAPLKMVSRVTDVSLEPLGDELFTIPTDYTVVKP
jgi:hypothetical protein